MGRAAERQRIEQKAELHRPFLADAERVEHCLLRFAVVNAHGAAAHFRAVQHEVVRTGQGGAWILPQHLHALRGGERMMRRRKRLPAWFEQRKLGDPYGRPARFHQPQLLAEFVAKRAHRVRHHLGGVRAEENDVAVLGIHPAQHCRHHVRAEELQDRRLQPGAAGSQIVHLDVGQTLGAVAPHEANVVVQLAARELAGGAGPFEGYHAAVRVAGRPAEHLEVHVPHQIRDVHQSQWIAQIRRIRAVLAHGLGVGEHREIRQFHANRLLEQRLQQAFGEGHHRRFVDEGRLDVDLRELRLAIGPQVLVAIAAGDLVVAVHGGHHQQLLEDLRRLRQGEEVSGMGAARHQIVPRALRRGFGERRRLHFPEALGLEEAAHLAGCQSPQTQPFLHLRAAQIQEAMPQPRFFAHASVVVQLDRRRGGFVEHYQRFA